MCVHGNTATRCPLEHGGYVPVPVAPDPERDKRVAARRAADAAKAGRALDRLLSECDGLGCRCCGNLQRLVELTQSQLHHNGHYDVSLATGGEMIGYTGEPLCSCGCGRGRDARHPA